MNTVADRMRAARRAQEKAAEEILKKRQVFEKEHSVTLLPCGLLLSITADRITKGLCRTEMESLLGTDRVEVFNFELFKSSINGTLYECWSHDGEMQYNEKSFVTVWYYLKK